MAEEKGILARSTSTYKELLIKHLRFPVYLSYLIADFATDCTEEDIANAKVVKQLMWADFEEQVEEQLLLDQYLQHEEEIIHNTLELDGLANYRFKFHEGCLHRHKKGCNGGKCWCFLNVYFEDYGATYRKWHPYFRMILNADATRIAEFEKQQQQEQ